MRIPLVMASIVWLLSVLTDIYIYYDIRRNFPSRKVWRGVYGMSSILCWTVLLCVVLSPYRSASQNITCIMWTMYAYATVYVFKIIFVIFSLLGSIPRIFRCKSYKLGKWMGLPLGAIAFFMLWWGAGVTRRQIQVTHTNIEYSRLPAAFNGYRIVQISDLHVGTWGEDTTFVSSLVDSVNAQNPDVIFFTGDIVNRETGELEPFLEVLSRLRAKDGVYSVLGNHDYGDYVEWEHPQDKVENLDLLKAWQKQIGWRLLNNQRAELSRRGETIQVIGVENWGEPPFHQYGHLTDAYPISRDSVYHLRDDRFKILLTHNPEHWRQESSKVSNIDLTLSGHTHAMQMVFEIGGWRWSPSSLKYEEWGGLYERENEHGENVKIYVNVGAGEVGMPFRIGGAEPEVSVITLYRPNSGKPIGKAGKVG